MSDKGDKAQALFEQGYNCCQAVALAFAQEMGLPEETVLRLASGFGGGLGRLREVCGAVSGMVLVTGMLHGYSEPHAVEEKKALYARVQKLAARYREANGSIVCKELLGLKEPEENSEPSVRTAEYYRKRPCSKLVRFAAQCLEEEEAASEQAR